MIVVDRSAIETRLQEKGLKKQAFLANSSPREGEAPAEPQVLFDVARRLRFGRSLTLPSDLLLEYYNSTQNKVKCCSRHHTHRGSSQLVCHEKRH